MHGGKLKLKSVLRKGTEVTLAFPRNRSMLSMPALPLGESEITQQLRDPKTDNLGGLPIADTNFLSDEEICSQRSTLELRTFIDQRINASKHPSKTNRSPEKDKSLTSA